MQTEITTQELIVEHNITEGRHGFTASDTASLPKRRNYDSREEAITAMAGNACAFRLYENYPFMGKWEIGILGKHFKVSREKKSKPYRLTGIECFATCNADAFDQLGEGDALYRIVDSHEWHAMQVRQHLREAGIKP